MKINFNKVLTLPETLVAGQIYYVDDIKSIVVAESDTKYVVYNNTPEIQNKINEILGGASDSYNTLKKIEDIIGSIDPELLEGFIPLSRDFSDDFNNDFTW